MSILSRLKISIFLLLLISYSCKNEDHAFQLSETHVRQFFDKNSRADKYQNYVIDFYQLRNYALAWFEGNSITARGKELLDLAGKEENDSIFQLIFPGDSLKTLLEDKEIKKHN